LIDPFIGAFHGVEIAFVWRLPEGIYWVDGIGPIPIIWADDELILQSVASSFWKNFSTFGIPTGVLSKDWPPYKEAADQHKVLDYQLTVESHLMKEKCDFWDTLPRN